MPFLADCIADIRRATDEPATNPKYTAAILEDMISKAYSGVWQDINRLSRRKTVVRLDLGITANIDAYVLPPTCTRIIDMQQLDTAGNVLSRFNPSSHLNPIWPGMVYEGNTLYFQDPPVSSWTLRILYEPSGFVWIHDGALLNVDDDAGTVNRCRLALANVPANGTLDLRENAYAGCILRILSVPPVGPPVWSYLGTGGGAVVAAGAAFNGVYEYGGVDANGIQWYHLDNGLFLWYQLGITTWYITPVIGVVGANHYIQNAANADPVAAPATYAGVGIYAGDTVTLAAGAITNIERDRLIRSYNHLSRVATVQPAYGYRPAELVPPATSEYEVLPILCDELEYPIALRVAQTIVAQQGDKERFNTQALEYQNCIRDVRLRESHFETILGAHFNIATVRSSDVIRSRMGRTDAGRAL